MTALLPSKATNHFYDSISLSGKQVRPGDSPYTCRP